MATQRSRLLEAAYGARDVGQNTNFVGTVHGINHSRDGLPLYDVLIHDRRGNTYGGNQGWIFYGCASAVPVQVGHRVFVTAVNGDLHQGGYITGLVDIPRLQTVKFGRKLGDREYIPLSQSVIHSSGTRVRPNPVPWITNRERTKPYPDCDVSRVSRLLEPIQNQVDSDKDTEFRTTLEDVVKTNWWTSFPEFFNNFEKLDNDQVHALFRVSLDEVGLTSKDDFEALSEADQAGWLRGSGGETVVCTSQRMRFEVQLWLGRIFGMNVGYNARISTGIAALFGTATGAVDLVPTSSFDVILFGRSWVKFVSRATGNIYYGQSDLNDFRISLPSLIEHDYGRSNDYGLDLAGVGIAINTTYRTILTICDANDSDFSWNIDCDFPGEVGHEMDVFFYLQLHVPFSFKQDQIAAPSLVMAQGWSFEMIENGIGSGL